MDEITLPTGMPANPPPPKTYSERNGEFIAGAAIVVFVDFFVGLPAAGVAVTTGFGSPPALAAEFIELTVVLPATLFGIYLMYDATH